MTRFILKRIGLGLITLWLLSILVFFMAHVLPGDVARRVLGPFADQRPVDAAQPAARHRPAARSRSTSTR